ncbi:MAG: molybdopterin synthase sulfur carrier subunit [Methylococcaceae bacterium]|nr:molybdopterin synthase sulfur carrier subunit [Methylococcaceae bacterium]
MSIKVRYFASLKENLAKSEDIVDSQKNMTVADVWLLANPDKIISENTLAAVNMDYVALTQAVNAGDEVAFFPPVTGG